MNALARKASGWRWALALAAVVLAAAALRLPGLTRVGLVSVDEGRYMLDGQAALVEAKVYGGILGGKLAEMRGGQDFDLAGYLPEAQDLLEAHTPFLPKVLFSWLVAGGIALTGSLVWPASAVEAGFGLLSVGAVFFLGRRLHSKGAGIAAAAMLAVSCYHTYYSRNAYPQTTSGFFLILSVLFHHAWAYGQPRPKGAWAFASGAAAGFCLAANFQAGGALPGLVVLHGAASFRTAGWWSRLKQFAAGGLGMAAGFAAVLILFEALTYPLLMVFHGFGQPFPHPTFFELLAPRLTMHSQIGWNVSGALLFPYFAWKFEGSLAFVAALGLAAAAAWVRPRGTDSKRQPPHGAGPWLYLLPMLLVPWFLFSFKTLQAARTFVYILPFVAIALGIALATIWQAPLSRPRRIRVLAAVLTGIGIVSTLPGHVDLLRQRSAYASVVAYLKEHEAGACAAWSSVIACYLDDAGLPGGMYFDYLERPEAMPRYYVSDLQEMYYGHLPSTPPALDGDYETAAVFEHRMGEAALAAELFPPYDVPIESIAYTEALDGGALRRVYLFDLQAPAE